MSVYSLTDPRTGRVRYVGLSKDPRKRLQQHMRRSHSPRMRRWISKLKRLGLSPVLRFLGPGTEADWVDLLGPDLNVWGGLNRGDSETRTGRMTPVILRPGRKIARQFRMAARAHRPALSLNRWLIQAAVERAERQGVKLGKAERQPDPAAPHGPRKRGA